MQSHVLQNTQASKSMNVSAGINQNGNYAMPGSLAGQPIYPAFTSQQQMILLAQMNPNMHQFLNQHNRSNILNATGQNARAQLGLNQSGWQGAIQSSVDSGVSGSNSYVSLAAKGLQQPQIQLLPQNIKTAGSSSVPQLDPIALRNIEEIFQKRRKSLTHFKQ
jgi:hypothetical protein